MIRRGICGGHAVAAMVYFIAATIWPERAPAGYRRELLVSEDGVNFPRI